EPERSGSDHRVPGVVVTADRSAPMVSPSLYGAASVRSRWVNACSLTEPPRDQVAYLRAAESMPPRISSEVRGREPQADERVDRLFDERNRSVRVLLSRGKPCGHAARTDAPGEDAPMQDRGVRKGRPIAGDIGRAASTPGVPGDEDVRVIDDEVRVRAHPLDATHGVNEIRRHVSRLIAYLPGEESRRAATRVGGDYREVSGLSKLIEDGDEILPRLPGPVQNDHERRGLRARAGRKI